MYQTIFKPLFRPELPAFLIESEMILPLTGRIKKSCDNMNGGYFKLLGEEVLCIRFYSVYAGKLGQHRIDEIHRIGNAIDAGMPLDELEHNYSAVIQRVRFE